MTKKAQGKVGKEALSPVPSFDKMTGPRRLLLIRLSRYHHRKWIPLESSECRSAIWLAGMGLLEVLESDGRKDARLTAAGRTLVRDGLTY